MIKFINKKADKTAMSKIISYVMIYFFVIATPSVLANNIYTIEKLSPKGLITISLSLPEKNSNSPIVKLSLRKDIPISTSQINNVRCGNIKLAQDSSGNWLVPVRCKKITWDVKAKVLGKNFFNIAEQLTFKVKNTGWILFSESSSLLRNNNNTDHLSLLVVHPDIPLQGATLYKSDLAYPVNYWLLPAEGSPPEFFVIGRPIIQSNDIGDMMIKYIIDDPNQINWLKLQDLHKKILLYYAKMLPLSTDLPKTERSLLVILVGSDVKNGQINGAAGRRSFIANYVVDKNKVINSLDNDIPSLLVLAHEQFHQFTDMVRFSHSVKSCAWIEESLAQYYALKAMQKVLSNNDYEKIKVKFINANNTVKFKFIEIEDQIKKGNYDNYSLFYSQGAQFWYEFNQVLLNSSNGKYEIDTLLPELINSDCNNSQLPKNFIQKAINISGNHINDLLERYVE